MFLDKIITIQKLDPDDENSDKEGYVTFLEAVKAYIQPAGIEYAVFSPQGEYGKMYRVWTTQSGIKEGMYIIVSGTITTSGTRMRVIGSQYFDTPIGSHSELLVTQEGL